VTQRDLDSLNATHVRHVSVTLLRICRVSATAGAGIESSPNDGSHREKQIHVAILGRLVREIDRCERLPFVRCDLEAGDQGEI